MPPSCLPVIPWLEHLSCVRQNVGDLRCKGTLRLGHTSKIRVGLKSTVHASHYQIVLRVSSSCHCHRKFEFKLAPRLVKFELHRFFIIRRWLGHFIIVHVVHCAWRHVVWLHYRMGRGRGRGRGRGFPLFFDNFRFCARLGVPLVWLRRSYFLLGAVFFVDDFGLFHFLPPASCIGTKAVDKASSRYSQYDLTLIIMPAKRDLFLIRTKVLIVYCYIEMYVRFWCNPNHEGLSKPQQLSRHALHNINFYTDYTDCNRLTCIAQKF